MFLHVDILDPPHNACTIHFPPIQKFYKEISHKGLQYRTKGGNNTRASQYREVAYNKCLITQGSNNGCIHGLSKMW